MIFEGMNFRISRTLSFRDSKEGDLNYDGSQIEESNVTFVYKKDAFLTEPDERGVQYLLTNNAPMGPKLDGHSLTNMAYGVDKWAREPWGGRFRVIPVYLAYGGRVHTARIKCRFRRSTVVQVKIGKGHYDVLWCWKNTSHEFGNYWSGFVYIPGTPTPALVVSFVDSETPPRDKWGFWGNEYHHSHLAIRRWGVVPTRDLRDMYDNRGDVRPFDFMEDIKERAEKGEFELVSTSDEVRDEVWYKS